MKVRFKEHTMDLRLNRTQKSALAEHSWKTGHQLCLEEPKVIVKIDHYGKRKIRESLEIEMNLNNLNRDDGWKLNVNWKPLISALKEKEKEK